jgi:hypothetical protein
VADHWTTGGFPGVERGERDGFPTAFGRTSTWLARLTATINAAADGLAVDLALYALSALFAIITVHSTLAPHREWGAIAAVGYATAAAVVLVQLAWWSVYRRALLGSRLLLTAAAWFATALLPLLVEAVQRAAGQSGRAQEEVGVIEEGGRRLVETGSPFLDRAAIAARPAADQLTGYLPYQPGMASFGLPRAAGLAWWSDARVWFAVVTAVALTGALLTLRRAGMARPTLIRAAQVASVLPICALTLATGGDDLPVLALSLLAFALAATGRLGGAGVAIGIAGSLKLFAWPVAVILGGYALTQRRLRRYAIGAAGLPVLTLIPALVISPSAVFENVIHFPLGQGLVHSPAASPLPGHLIAESLRAGHIIAAILLALAGAWIVWILVRRPPRTAAAAARLTGWAMLAAILLLPATRFGYLLYPAAFFVWAPALRPRAIPAPRTATADARAPA